ncbi:2-succinyl-6-hydroxy-2,4-cyclohexadiene-1-carboxylate synthase [Nostoc flagelliforme FACHB-838]|uniref:Putative 2-succinyl-6-hydroxy-2,4-cyclohexadiene-1-carboxylate synthase n=1 Tax=Nostoc flagelliforme FACHB-838 TaxID=2692904 RepID=A0ABR8DGP6_9NOSO|nr:2-succinyl-6-hydroxy-2,4-cyclohexadiene-1-carboxylate synthase [Nostoc flagelliforme]MBD2528116.1 2-succinyl-6-hydroxy-2,4-cyclohexadiene-1-carboxylate synthase [Nostoc flagelliforme FACHB-838]
MILKNYQFHYSLIGTLDKPLILFLHGFMGNIDEFDEAIKLLFDKFSYLTIDLPGHGKTQVLGGNDCYTMVNTAHALINLLDELKIAECFLVGYSMGGRLALYLTLHFPERFLKVVLESASPGLPTEVERLERIKIDTQIGRKLTRSIKKSDFATFLSNWYNQPIFGYIKNYPEYDRMVESRLQNNPEELDKSLRFMGTGCQPSLWEELPDNKIPLLLLAGEYDEKFISINTEMAKLCKFAQLKIISNAGHNIHFENTLAFVENVKDFLSTAS